MNKNDFLDIDDADHINDMVNAVGRFNLKQGWREKSDQIRYMLNGRPDLLKAFENYLAGTMIALIHSELSEALEGLRKDLMDDKLPHRKMVEVEMADVLIRVFDFADYFRLDLGSAMVEKDAYNHHRPDHKLENRMKEGGKSF